MKGAALLLTASMAWAMPQKPPGDDVPINCAKANANYCMAGDIILRCDENAIGTAGRCSPNLSGYPPSGGVARCWQSGEEVGDAACEKNCVVYPEPPDAAFTLAADDCTPSHTETGTIPSTTQFPNSTITTHTTLTITTCDHECTSEYITDSLPPPPPTNGTWVPTETHPPPPPPPTNGTWVPTETHAPPPPPPGTTSEGGEQPPPPPGTTTGGGGEEPTNIPIPPTTTAGGVEPIPTGAAAANKVGPLLAAAGFAAAYLI